MDCDTQVNVTFSDKRIRRFDIEQKVNRRYLKKLRQRQLSE